MLPVIHIGYPKTGTTTLQRHLFGCHPRILSIGKPTVTPEGALILENLTKPDVSITELDAAAKWLPAIHKTGHITVLSHESLARSIYTSPKFGMPLPERALRMFGPVKVMIGTRSQHSWIESHYLHHTRPAEYKSIADYTDRLMSLYDLNFASVAELYRKHLGKENVEIFPLELLAKAPQDYIKRVADFIGVPLETVNLNPPQENQRKSGRMIWYSRMRSFIPVKKLSRFAPSRVVQTAESILLKGRRASIQLPDGLRSDIENRVRDCNKILSSDYGLDLKALGYPT